MPILYSFRRCPYAMRARMALHISDTAYELREVQLKNKPAALLAASPKASVPVLALPEGRVIDESWDIMQWALRQHDPHNWLGEADRHIQDTWPLVEENDGSFKDALDRYKYADRHPEHPQAYYRTLGESFLQKMESRLEGNGYLLGSTLTLADAAIFPFIRQFAGVEPDWFVRSPYPNVRKWMAALIQSTLFSAIMEKHPVWNQGDAPVVICGARGSQGSEFSISR